MTANGKPAYHLHMALSKYSTEYDAIVKTMQMYVDARPAG